MPTDLLRRVHACRVFAATTTLAFLLCLTPAFAGGPEPSSNPGLAPILKYIDTGWDTLTRSMTDCNTVVDPKLIEESILYLPAGSATPAPVAEMQQRCHVNVEQLPAAITGPGQVTSNITPPGLLYLPNRYVVPGGRFNEMYGWDSYFIMRGLLAMTAARARPRHDRKLLLRDRTLRRGPQRQPHLLSDALAAAISYLDDPGRLRRGETCPATRSPGWRKDTNGQSKTTRSGSTNRTWPATPASPATTISATAPLLKA